jgi:hypothetical protein
MKKIKLPKDSLVEPEEKRKDAPFIDEADVEGHGLPTTAPPGIGAQFPGHGGEATPTKDKDDVKGHRRK